MIFCITKLNWYLGIIEIRPWYCNVYIVSILHISILMEDKFAITIVIIVKCGIINVSLKIE